MTTFTPKIIFFDIDDTLSRNGILAEHNKTTLEQLASTDIKVVIATGRAMPVIPYDIIELHDNRIIDAIICMNGQYIFKKDGNQNQLIKHYPLTMQQAESIVSICQEENTLYKFESTTHIGWSGDSQRDKRIRELINENHHFIIDPTFYQNHEVYQCSVFFDDNDKMEHIDFNKYGLKLVHWHAIGADILPIEASKARAVKDICTYYGISPTDCMAFGDGYNDIEMFQLVGYPVAMGDGADQLKEVAINNGGMITDSIEDRGIQNALTKIGLL